MITELSELIKSFPTTSFLMMVFIFALMGYFIVTRYLMEKQIRNFLPKTIFIATFACSVSLLAMYLYEISLIHMSEALWDLILSIQVILCTIVIPIALLLKLPLATYQLPIGSQTKIPIFGIIIILAYLRVLSYWSTEIKNAKKFDDDIGLFTKKHINVLVEILVNYGVVIMALMSAYGAIWCPYIYFNHRDSKRDDLTLAKKKTKQQIFFIIDQIKKSKRKVLNLKERKQQLLAEIAQVEQRNSGNRSFFVQTIYAIKSSLPIPDRKKQELNAVNESIEHEQNELNTLNRVHHETFSIYREIADEERKHLISDTLIGKIFWIFSFVLAVYSVSRFVLTAWNMIKGRKLSTDPITRFLNFIVWILGEDINDTFRKYVQYISFGFMGYLMISSVRSFSINIKNFFDFILRRRRLNILSTDTLVFLLSQMYGIYFLSAVILLQSSLPRTYVTNFEHIVGTVLLVEHFTLFDKLFFWCCILSLGFIMLCEWQRKQKLTSIIKERNLVNFQI